MIKNYIHIIKKYGVSLCILLIIMLISSALTVAMTYMGGKYIDIVIEGKGMFSVYKICIILLGITIINLGLRFFLNIKTPLLIEKIVYSIKENILNHLRCVSMYEYSQYNSIHLSKKIDEDTKEIVGFFVNNYSKFIVKTVEIITITILLLQVNIFIGTLVLLLSPFYYILYKKFRKGIFKSGLIVKEKETTFFKDYSSQLEFLEDIVIQGEFEKEDTILRNRYSSLYDSYKNYNILSSLLSFSSGILICIMQILIFIFGGISVYSGYISVGVLSIMMAYFLQILNNITYYIDFGKNMQIAKTSLYRINRIFDIKTEEEGKIILRKIDSIVAKVEYKLANNKTVANAEFKVEKGNVIGILGKNGTGKTTLIKILMGIYKKTNSKDGIVIYNSTDRIENINMREVRKNLISYVPQKIRYRDSSLMNLININRKINNPNDLFTTLEERQIILDSDIQMIFKEKWDENINTFSGGDKQIVTIICSLLKSSNMLILDEPTSNLDMDKIEWFCNIVNDIKKDKIIFIVTHDERIKKIFDTSINL